MKKQWLNRLLALVLALLLAVPAFALAEGDVEETEVVEAEIVDQPVESEEEIVQDLPVEETSEEACGDLVEAPAETPAEAPVEEPVGAPAEAPAEEAAAPAPVAEEIVAVEEDPSAKVASVAINQNQGNVFYLGMGPVQLSAAVQPEGEPANLRWKSSKKKVAKIDANGVLTPRKAGKTKITVTAGKKKSSMKVTIRKNMVDYINPRPTVASLASTGRSWDFFLKSVERKPNGSYVCKVYLMNNLGRSKYITNLGFRLSVGGTVIAEKVFPKVRISCKKGRAKVFKVTFDVASLANHDALLLPSYGTNFTLDVINNPVMTYLVRR